MIKQKVFIPVSVEDELPGDGDIYFCESNIGEVNIKRGTVYFNPNANEWYQPNYTHWLKEQEGYFFTPLQFVELLTSVFDAGLKYDGTSDFIDNYIQSLNIK